jgi:hypothetical protein
VELKKIKFRKSPDKFSSKINKIVMNKKNSANKKKKTYDIARNENNSGSGSGTKIGSRIQLLGSQMSISGQTPTSIDKSDKNIKSSLVSLKNKISKVPQVPEEVPTPTFNPSKSYNFSPDRLSDAATPSRKGLLSNSRGAKRFSYFEPQLTIHEEVENEMAKTPNMNKGST